MSMSARVGTKAYVLSYGHVVGSVCVVKRGPEWYQAAGGGAILM